VFLKIITDPIMIDVCDCVLLTTAWWRRQIRLRRRERRGASI